MLIFAFQTILQQLATIIFFDMEKQSNQPINFNEKPTEEMQHGNLKERLGRVKPMRWVRFAAVSALFVGWVCPFLGQPFSVLVLVCVLS